MPTEAEPHSPVADVPKSPLKRRFRGVLIVAMAGLAIASAFWAGALSLFLVGILLMVCGVLEMLETFSAPDEARRRSAYIGGALSILAGMILLAEPSLVLRGLSLFVAASFLLDALGKVVTAARMWKKGEPWKWLLVRGLINAALGLMIVTRWPVSGQAVVVILVGIRMFSVGWPMLLGRMPPPAPFVEAPRGLHPDRRLGLPPRAEFEELEQSIMVTDVQRRWADFAWCWTFILVFFAIHIGRMRVDFNLVGMIAPLVAVAGDIATALVIAFGLILPFRLGWRKLTRPLERRGWERLLARGDQGRGPGLLGRYYRVWLQARLRFSQRMADMRWSPRAALRWGFQVGLPATAILIAINPMWGFSWFFNSESWAAGVWDRWAAQRTDTWREKMVEAIQAHYRAKNIPDERMFDVDPPGVAGSADFSFLVLGDTGEGGAAQHSLRDQYLFLGQRPDMKFLVISSDVIYPSGAMMDYEPNFYLPFKGFTKPIYAIPGNHDWYDALEGFAANFFEADAARTCMHARLDVDNRWTTTTPRSIEDKITEAARLRKEFGVSTGWQRGPFFEVQTERFALIAVDTGVLRRIDTDQMLWLKSALARAKGKFIMAILGHPLYAGGRYQGGTDEPLAGEWVPPERPSEVAGLVLGTDTAPFSVIHQLLREHHVDVVMAGDTHYFEYYRESYQANGSARTMHHFVNGGGGAYTSIGTALDWPHQPAVPDCCYFPRRDFLVTKMDRDMPAWKKPMWWWVKDLRAWPLTAETMAGAFVYSRAPYFQSFVEIQVKGSANEVHLIVHGANGPLRWRDLQLHGTVIPAGKNSDDLVDFVVPMPNKRP